MELVLEINKVYDFAWCVIADNNVYLFNNSFVKYSTEKDTALVNVQVVIDELGLLHIKGDQLIWKFTSEKIKIEDLNETVSELGIRHSNGIKWLGIKPYSYVYGWYRLENPEPAQFLLNTYKIIIQD
jgi:hypothetical protein